MGNGGGNFIAMLVIILLSLTLKFQEYYNLEGVLDAMELDGRVRRHSYENKYDFNRASPVPFLQTHCSGAATTSTRDISATPSP